MNKILNIYKLREFDDKEREFFLTMYKSFLDLRDHYPHSQMLNSEEYVTLDTYELLATEEEIKVYKRDHVIDTALKDE